MKKVIRLTESDLTRIVKQVIQKEQMNESKKLKTLALGLGITVSTLLPSCSSEKFSEENIDQQASIFKKKLNKLEEITPEDLTLSFMETVKNNPGFQNWDKDMVNRQITTFYRIDGEKHMKLCAEMIAYQLNKCGEDKKVKIQVGEYVKKLNKGKLDKIDLLILESFNQGIESIEKQFEIENESDYLY